MHLLDAIHHKSNPLLKSQPESRHASVCDSNLASLGLLPKNRNHAAAACQHVPVTRATEPRILRACIGICLHEHFFSAQLCGSVEIDRIDRLIGAESQDAL